MEAHNDESVEDSKSEYGYHRYFELISHLLIPPCTIQSSSAFRTEDIPLRSIRVSQRFMMDIGPSYVLSRKLGVGQIEDLGLFYAVKLISIASFGAKELIVGSQY